MAKFSNDKDVNKLVKILKKSGWGYQRKKKHGVIIPPMGAKITIPGSPSDCRSFSNFQSQVYKVINNA